MSWAFPFFPWFTPVPEWVDRAPKALKRNIRLQTLTARSHSCWSHQWLPQGNAIVESLQEGDWGTLSFFLHFSVGFSSFSSGTMGTSSLHSFLISTHSWGCWGVRLGGLDPLGAFLMDHGDTGGTVSAPCCGNLFLGKHHPASAAAGQGQRLCWGRILWWPIGLCATGSFFH